MRSIFKTIAVSTLTAVLIASVAFAANRPRFSGSSFAASDAIAATGWTWTGIQSISTADAAVPQSNTLYLNGNTRTVGFTYNGTDVKVLGPAPVTASSDQAINLGKPTVRWSNLYITGLNIGISGVLTDSATAPTISSGFGTSPSVTAGGSTSFRINVGTGGTANSGVIGLPAAANGWNCFCNDVTTASATVFMCKQTGSSTTSATIGNFNTAGAAAAWVASDIVEVNCRAY